VGDNIAAGGCDRQFKNEVVIGIRQGRPPEEEDFLKVAGGEQEIQKTLGLHGSAGEQVLRAQQHGAVFEKERHGDNRLEFHSGQTREKRV
jgi:hypothetical protein